MAGIPGVRDPAGRSRPRPAAARHAPPAPTRGGAPPHPPAPASVNTTQPPEETPLPGSQEIERRIKSLIRWNAMAMVVRANQRPTASAATSRPSPRRPRSTKSASTTSSAARARRRRRHRSISRATPRPASTRARSSKAGSRSEKLENFRRELQPGGGPVVLSASVADAGLLGVPDGVDGPRPDHGDLPGALQPLPEDRGLKEPSTAKGVGVPRRRRDRRAGDARRDHAGRARKARQPDLRHQLQPAAARRSGARQRQDHPGAGSHLPRRRLERHQGDLGQRLGSAAGQGQDGLLVKRMGEVVDGEYQKYGRIRRLHPRALLRRRSAAARRWSSTYPTSS